MRAEPQAQAQAVPMRAEPQAVPVSRKPVKWNLHGFTRNYIYRAGQRSGVHVNIPHAEPLVKRSFDIITIETIETKSRILQCAGIQRPCTV